MDHGMYSVSSVRGYEGSVPTSATLGMIPRDPPRMSESGLRRRYAYSTLRT
jgi:hypothetical protein